MQNLADLVRTDGVGGGGVSSLGVGGSSAEATATLHVAAARGMTLALAALLGLVRQLELLKDHANHHTFSLTIGECVRRTTAYGSVLLFTMCSCEAFRNVGYCFAR